MPRTHVSALCVLLAVCCSTLARYAVDDIQHRNAHDNARHYETDFTKEFRNKRETHILTSALLKGFKAVTDLIKRATHMPSDGNAREYIKYGDYKNAVDDFFSVRPFDVKRVKFTNGAVGMRGRVGDRTIVIKSYDEEGKTAMEILKSYISQTGYLKSIRTERIIYDET